MADMKKDQERDELFRTIYKIATDLVHAGHVSEWDFKSYVLGTMFYRYISENFAAYINAGEHAAGNTGFDYAKISDEIAETIREDMIQTKGFFILPSELFCNVRTRADKDENLNETLERVFDHIESSAASGDAENDFAGLFDDFDVNSKSIGETVAKRNKVLAELLNGVDKMPLFSTDGINPDLFGDAYEYLMGMYAANAGKKGGQYFTPADVSELLARLGTIGKTRVNKVYDPACGSGSLLLKAEKVLGKDNIERGFFGQEIDLTTYNLCRINMFLHNIDFDKFSIVREDTLLSPRHWDDQPFELIVSNPPFSVPWEGNKNPLLINDPRFSPAGVLAPASKGDMAFIMHSLSWLASNGAAAIVCFPGIMYRGGAEQKIRKYLVDNNYIDAIIQLPSNLFLNVTISVDIMLLKKSKTDSAILFVDASREFVKVTKNNRLSEANIQRIVSAAARRTDEPYFSRLVPNDEVGSRQNNYNLSVSTYVEQEDTREKIDIVKLNAEIAEIVAREQVLRDEIDKIVKEIEGWKMKRIEKDKPLPKHTKLDYDECYAKTVLESLLQKQLYDLTPSDRPDLFSEELNIGIEVTTAISQNEQERMNCWADIPYVNEGQKKRKIERMQQLKVEYQGGIQGWPVRDYSSNEIEDTPINEIKMAFEKKVKKLNSGNYRLFSQNNLFIYSDVWLCKNSFKQSLLKILIAKNSDKEKFTYVYLLVPGNFYVFDLVNKKYSEIPVESCLQAGWAVQARKMVEEGEDDG